MSPHHLEYLSNELNAIRTEMHITEDDFVYVVLLLLGVGFGHFYRKIRDVEPKMFVGTFFGVMIILSTSGVHSLHMFLTFLVCYIIINVFKS